MSNSISQRYREDVEALQAELDKARELITDFTNDPLITPKMLGRAKAFLTSEQTEGEDNG